MNTINKICFYLAIAGLLTSALIFCTAFTNFDVEEAFPFIMLLHLGVFAVFLPAIIELKSRKSYTDYNNKPFWERFRGKGMAKVAFETAPKWFRMMAIAIFLVGCGNMWLFASKHRDIKEENGHYFVYDRAGTHEEVGPEEFHRSNNRTTSGFAGVWMAFYVISAAVLYPGNKKELDQYT